MIVATAGHIDHGKTSLVKALTDVDTDRLPEEKARGLTIDLGFAYQAFGEDGHLGFVDVPGHERFVRTMIAGVAAIDYALLVVAADDGPMPQTLEHLAILDLLGVGGGAVVITKCDMVPTSRISDVECQVAGLIAGTVLEAAPVFHVSTTMGQGISALRDHLHVVAPDVRTRNSSSPFRFVVDRAFSVSGAGLVVTGAAISGRVHVGDHVVVSPAGIPVRVRAVHALNRQAEEGYAGQRCGLNIAGPRLDPSKVTRGDWIVTEAAHAPTSRIDAHLRLLGSEEKAFRHWTPVHVHLGAADVPGRVALLDGEPISPGRDGRVQIVLDREVAACWGDRFILRDQSAWRTIGGGWVTDPFAPARGRARPERIAALDAMEIANPRDALPALLEASSGGVDLDLFARARNLPAEGADTLSSAVPMVVARDGPASWGVALNHWNSLLERVKNIVDELHDASPRQSGVPPVSVARAMSRQVPRFVVSTLVQELVSSGKLVQEAGRLRLPGRKIGLEPRDASLWMRLRPHFETSALRPPSVAQLAELTAMERKAVEHVLQQAARFGLTVQVTRNRYFLPAALEALGQSIENLVEKSSDHAFSVAEFRDKTGIGRNLSVDVVEYFDRIGFTRRVGEKRVVLKPLMQISWSRVA